MDGRDAEARREAAQQIADFGGAAEIEGYEILSRLVPLTGKSALPEQFISRLESLNRIAEMTWQVAEPGFALARAFHQAGRPFSISLNISAQMLDDDALLERLSEKVAAHGLDPRQITLEITESAAVDSRPGVLERLVHLRLRGFGLAIDDFGTGFSSLAQLSKLPFTEMKIDRLFTSSVVSNPKARAVVESSIHLARRLGMKTCAEGVDSEAVYRLMRELGADSFQGYHFHRPLPAREFTRWVQDWTITSADRQ
ncbi:MAG: EAL domain-containing protein [Stagnimonas sp.]|nr:EAL domain-containing protein [Stagnimonas sp.]